MVMQHPIVRNLWPNRMNSFSESLKDLTIVMLINCLSLRHEFLMNNTFISMDLIFDLLILASFRRGELLVCHSELCRLVSRSYSKIHNSSPFMTCLKIKSSFSMLSRRSRHTFIRFSVYEPFWNKLFTNFLQAQFLSQNVVDGSVIQIQLITDHSDCQTSIRPNESPHVGHIFVRF